MYKLLKKSSVLIPVILLFTTCSGVAYSENNRTQADNTNARQTDNTREAQPRRGGDRTRPRDNPNNPPPPATGDLTTVHDGTQVLSSALISLGQSIYNDTNLSEPAGQSCASCHTPTIAAGFDDPDSNQPTSLGANGSSFGTRNSPTTSYVAHIPPGQTILRVIGGVIRPIQFGGQFLDGRASTLEEQAKAPFLNPDEMAIPSSLELIQKIQQASYAGDFEALFGIGVLDNTELSFNYITDAIAAFERTDLFSPFSSRFDQGNLTASEARGQRLFNGRAICDTCHQSPSGFREVFSDFEFRNIGVPRNLTLLSNIGNQNFIDRGLGGVTNNPLDDGRFRTPTLRNIANTAPYMHNGVFNTLTEVVQFYNTRDTSFTQPPEISRNLNQGRNIGELRLNARDVQDIVAFLETLTDQ